jgi:hypothetical protein
MRGEWTKLEATPVAPPPDGSTKADGEKELRKERPTSASDMDDARSCWSDMHRVTLLDWVRSTQETAFFGPGPNAQLNAGTMLESSGMSRATSAPALRTRNQQNRKKEPGSGGQLLGRPQSQGSITSSSKRDTDGRRPQSQGASSRLPVPEIPVVPDQRWGSEAHDRFRLYNTLRCQENEDRLRAERALAVRDARNNYAYKLPFACQLCHDHHELEICSLRGM